MKASGWLHSAVTTMHVLSMQTTPVRDQLYFSLSSVVSHAFSAHAHAMRLFDVHASSSPLGYPFVKFHFCSTPPRCWASPQKKARTESLTQPLNHSVPQLIWFARNRSFCFRIYASPVWTEKEPICFLCYLLQSLADSDKIWYFAIQQCKRFPPHLNNFSTLPCES